MIKALNVLGKKRRNLLLENGKVDQPQHEGTSLGNKIKALLGQLSLYGNVNKVAQSSLACNHSKCCNAAHSCMKGKNAQLLKSSTLEPCVDYLIRQKVDLTGWLQ